MEEGERSHRRFVCAADESIDDEADTVASHPKGQEQEGSVEASLRARREGQQSEKGAEGSEMLPQIQTKVPEPLVHDLPEFLAPCRVRTPTICDLFLIFISQSGLK